jgi:hypothetical protein
MVVPSYSETIGGQEGNGKCLLKVTFPGNMAHSYS